MTDEELIALLRDDSGNWLTDAAADRIEALVKEQDDAVIKRAAWELEAKTQQARAERLEEAMILMRDDRTAFRHAVHFRRFVTTILKGDEDAADRIEALTEQLAAARKDAEEAEAYAGELEKEREEARAAWEIEAATVKRFAERHTRHLVMGAEARDRAERAEAKLEKAVGLLEAWVELSEHCSIEEGVCCCGDNMDTHAEPMDCGHSPVDHGAYVARGLVEETNSTLAELKGESHD